MVNNCKRAESVSVPVLTPVLYMLSMTVRDKDLTLSLSVDDGGMYPDAFVTALLEAGQSALAIG